MLVHIQCGLEFCVGSVDANKNTRSKIRDI